MKNWKTMTRCALLAVAGTAATAWATNTNEVEPNDDKANATPVLGMVTGDTITGNSISATADGLDYFRVKTAGAAPGIYRHRLVLDSATPGHTVTLRGLNQSGGVPGTTDSTVQTGSTTLSPARAITWYGFGSQEEIYYRVTGGAATTSDYVATLETVPQSFTTVVGSILPGNITILPDTATSAGWDTDWWVYDGNFNARPDFGHDDSDTTGITRSLTPGDYYIAFGNFNTCNNLGSPSDDTFRTGLVLDFPNAVANASTAVVNPAAPTVSITSDGGTILTTGEAREQLNGVVWFKFTVGDAFAAGCGTSTGVEGQNVAIRVNAHAAAGTTISSVVVNASAINPGATAVNLTNLGGDSWGADVLSTVTSGSYSFSYVVTNSLNATLNGTCNAAVTDSPSGACCAGATCDVSREYLCLTSGGTFQGAGTNCGVPTYAAAPGTATFASIAGTGTVLGTISACDDCAETITLPFPAPFDFYGVGYTSAGVSSNGLIVFGGINAALGNVAIPNAAAPNNFATALWDDLNPSVAGDVYSYYDSVANTLTLSWEGVPQFANTDSNSFQVILHGNTGNIDLVYGTITAEATVGDYSAGIEDATGSGASVNAGTPVADTSVRITFTPGSNPCGSGCDSVDFNGDGLFPDTQDITDFIFVYGGGACPTGTCGDIDFNNDGLFPDTDDITTLIRVFGGGDCTP